MLDIDTPRPLPNRLAKGSLKTNRLNKKMHYSRTACNEIHEGFIAPDPYAELSEASFNDYRARFGDNGEATYFSMICNGIKDYRPDTMFLHCDVHTRPDGCRPLVAPHQADHPLVRDYTHGISYQEAKARTNAAFKRS